MALVREYAESNSEQAFATLVSRHVNLVYSVALRHVGNPHLAEEITQGVFIILARKAKSLSPKTIVSGWLCRTARYVSANTLKIQRRRQFPEQETQMQSISSQSDSTAWHQIAPLLDEALNCLGEKEHDAIVLRFFDCKELKHIGAAMGTTEDAARMRVNRGLEKLRKFFTKRGVTLSAAAIAGAVSVNSVQAAPAGLASTVTAAVFSGITITTAAVIAATKAIAIGALRKTLATSIVAMLAGALLILLLWAAGSAIFEWPLLWHYAGKDYSCAEILLHIEGSKRVWARETGQTNGAPVDPVQLERHFRTKGYFSGGEWLHCPSGGTYTYGNLGQLPTCSLANNHPVKERVSLFGWRWESHAMRPDWRNRLSSDLIN